jgi:hypothetical protein
MLPIYHDACSPFTYVPCALPFTGCCSNTCFVLLLKRVLSWSIRLCASSRQPNRQRLGLGSWQRAKNGHSTVAKQPTAYKTAPKLTRVLLACATQTRAADHCQPIAKPFPTHCQTTAESWLYRPVLDAIQAAHDREVATFTRGSLVSPPGTPAEKQPDGTFLYVTGVQSRVAHVTHTIPNLRGPFRPLFFCFRRVG